MKFHVSYNIYLGVCFHFKGRGRLKNRKKVLDKLFVKIKS